MPIPLYRPFYKRKEMDAVLTTLVEHSPGPGQQHEKLVEQLLDEFSANGGLALRSRVQAYEAVLRSLKELGNKRIGMTVLMPRYLLELANSLDFEIELFDVVSNSSSPRWSEVNALQDDRKLDAFFLQHDFGINAGSDEDLNDAEFILVEDISEGVLGKADEGLLGSLGDYIILGLEENHSLPSGMGALVMARDTKQVKALDQACTTWDSEYYLADLNSSLALQQIKEYKKSQERRWEIVASFDQAIQKGKHRFFGHGSREQLNLSSYPIVLSSPVKEVTKYATKRGVETKLAFNHTILQEYTEEDSEKTIQLNWNRYPNARDAVLRTVLFPCYPAMRKQELEIIQKVLSTLP